MKNKLRKCSTVLFLSILISNHSNATVLLVNNAPGGPGMYVQIDDAIAAASAGDTIYVSGNTAPYANCTIDKSIVLIGPGTFAQKQNNISAKLAIININNNITGVVIKGFNITNGIYLDNKTNINNVQISFNHFNGYNAIYCDHLTNSANIMISSNTFDSYGNNVINFWIATNVTNVNIENNIITGSIYALMVNNGIIKNNVFYNNGGAGAFSGGVYASTLYQVTNAQIINNIFFNADPLNYTSGCVFQNNITYSNTTTYPLLDILENNINNTNPLFVNAPFTGGFSVSNNYHLLTGSPAIGSGLGGTDMGFYGGSNPVTYTGEVLNLPVVRQMNIINSNVPQNGNVNVKVRSTISRTN